jgi:hypothetical protein
MAKINNYDALTNTNAEIMVTTAEISKMLANVENVSIETIMAEKAAAKAALLERLGITAEEAALLLGGN